MRRIISLWLPLWSINLRLRLKGLSDKPLASAFALTETENQTQKLYAVCPKASAIGLQKGMTLAEARAIQPDLIVEPATPDLDVQKREELARWLVRYTPLTAPDTYDQDSILLDTSGCAHLFGGEKSMMADIQGRLASAGFSTQIAVAENRAAAWALSHYLPGSISLSAKESKRLLAPLHIHALRLDAATELTLVRLGLKTIGSLFNLPRPALAQRFRGHPAKQITGLLMRLDQLLGRYEEPFSPLLPLPSWRVQQAFGEPATHLPIIEATAQHLLERLLGILAQAEKGIRRLSLHAFRVDGGLQRLVIGTNRPSRDKNHLFYLLSEKFEQLEAEFGFDFLMLSAEETEALAAIQISSDKNQKQQSASELLDRFTARLGAQAVRRLKNQHSHLPERSQTLVGAHVRTLDWDTLPQTKALRPLRLLSRPEPIDVLAEVPEGPPRRFLWRRAEHRITKAAGPERIAPEWWLSPASQTRDYYRVEAENGARFWLFRYGLYPVPGVQQSQERPITTKPAWYMHGFFA